MHQQERLALVLGTFRAWERGEAEAFSAAMDALYAATDGQELISARTLDLVLARRTQAAQAGADQAEVGVLLTEQLQVIVEWVGCDAETFMRALINVPAGR